MLAHSEDTNINSFTKSIDNMSVKLVVDFLRDRNSLYEIQYLIRAVDRKQIFREQFLQMQEHANLILVSDNQ